MRLKRRLKKGVENTQEKRPLSKIPISEEMAEIFEKWRRGEEYKVDVENLSTV